MSYNNFLKALELSKECNGYEILGNVKETKIREAEKILSISFSRQHFDYYKKIGLLSYYGSEFYGLSNRELTGLPGSNSVLLALTERKETSLPHEWIPIYFLDGGYNAYLDYSNLNENEEPRIISAYYNGNNYIVNEILAEDLGDFILTMVKEQLANQ